MAYWLITGTCQAQSPPLVELAQGHQFRPSHSHTTKPTCGVSTGPPQLQQEEVRTGIKRKRKVTEAYTEARHVGFPSLGYLQ
jgi:hypothetical protein